MLTLQRHHLYATHRRHQPKENAISVPPADIIAEGQPFEMLHVV